MVKRFVFLLFFTFSISLFYSSIYAAEACPRKEDTLVSLYRETHKTRENANIIRLSHIIIEEYTI